MAQDNDNATLCVEVQTSNFEGEKIRFIAEDEPLAAHVFVSGRQLETAICQCGGQLAPESSTNVDWLADSAEHARLTWTWSWCECARHPNNDDLVYEYATRNGAKEVEAR